MRKNELTENSTNPFKDIENAEYECVACEKSYTEEYVTEVLTETYLCLYCKHQTDCHSDQRNKKCMFNGKNLEACGLMKEQITLWKEKKPP